MAESRGRFNVIKKRLITIISESDIVLQPNINQEHVHGDWRTPLRGGKGGYANLPVVSVRFSPIDEEDATYGRVFEGGVTPSYGNISDIAFSLHVHTSACDSSTEDRGKYVQELSEKIVSNLINERYNNDDIGIFDITDINQRESDVENQGWRICRIIINGRIHAKRYHTV